MLALVAGCTPAPTKKGSDPDKPASSPATEQQPSGQEETPHDTAPPEDDGPSKRIDPGASDLAESVESPNGATANPGSSVAPGVPGPQTADPKPTPGVLTQRCATRLSIALSGKSADATTLATKDVPTAVDRLLATSDFSDRFARFINAEFNGAPAASGAEDPVYWLAQHVISTNKPWSDLFLGAYALKAQGTTRMTVSNDPKGLGYFRNPVWMKRYAGNAPEGYMLAGAFRILSNTTALELVPSVGQPDEDRSAEGRAKQPCASCHFEKWYALDKVARLLPRKQGTDMDISFKASPDGPQTLLGKELADDKALIAALVDSDAWRFAQCRYVFKFLYGRAENKCEAPAFDRCVDALVKEKTIRAAVAAVAKDGAVCQ